jgi:chromate transporter
MNAGMLLQVAEVFALLSAFSFGGVNALLPEVHRQVVELRGWMSDATFSDIFAVSNAAPGPNIIMISLIGWQLSGLAGLAVATLAAMTPSCLITFTVNRLLKRYSGSRAIKLFKEAMVPVALGPILASGVAMMRTADTNDLLVAFSLATAAFVVFSARNPLWAFGTVTGLAVLAQHFGMM